MFHESKGGNSDLPLPYTEEGEIGVICCLLHKPSLAREIRQEIGTDYFYSPGARFLYSAILALLDKGKVASTCGIDFQVLARHLADTKHPGSGNWLKEIGNRDRLNEIFNFVPSAANWKYYADDLREKWARREKILACRREEKAAFNLLSPATEWDPDGSFLGSANGKEMPWNEALSKGTCSAAALSKMAIIPREPLIDDWCKAGDLGFIFAKRGVGKTWLGMHLAKGLATKINVGPWKIHNRASVLYLDGEMPAGDVKQRVNWLGQQSSENLVYANHEILCDQTGRIMNIADPIFQTAILEFCQAGEFTALFLDNLSTLASGIDENKNMDWEVIQPWLLKLRRAHITVFFIHHGGRNNEMRGGSKREDPSFWVIRLDQPNSAEPSDGAHFISRFTKWRNASKQPKTYEWIYKPEINGEVLVEVREASPLQIFHDHVFNGLDTCTEIAIEMDATNGYISQLAKKAQDQGWLRIEKRKYVLKGMDGPER
jgi:hypothetical protein